MLQHRRVPPPPALAPPPPRPPPFSRGSNPMCLSVPPPASLPRASTHPPTRSSAHGMYGTNVMHARAGHLFSFRPCVFMCARTRTPSHPPTPAHPCPFLAHSHRHLRPRAYRPSRAQTKPSLLPAPARTAISLNTQCPSLLPSPARTRHLTQHAVPVPLTRTRPDPPPHSTRRARPSCHHPPAPPPNSTRRAPPPRCPRCNDICRALRLQSLTGRAKPSQHGTQWGPGAGKRPRAGDASVHFPPPTPTFPLPGRAVRPLCTQVSVCSPADEPRFL